jgi:hypothetical protein
MVRVAAASCGAAVAWLAVSSARGDDEGSPSTNLEFVLPTSLMKKSVYHRNAMFGTPFSVPEIVGEVQYLEGDACDSKSYEGMVPPQPKDFPRIYLVNRGECTFAHKTRLAQSKGAAAVLVVNNVCSSANKAAWEASGLASVKCSGGYQDNMPYMAYDNSGRDIAIPAFLLSMLDGQYLKNCFLEKTERTSSSSYAAGLILPNGGKDKCDKSTRLLVKAKLDVPVTGPSVNWEMWMQVDALPEDLPMIGDVAAAIESSSKFTPRYIALKAGDLGCDKPGMCEDMCLFNPARDGFCMLPAHGSALNGSQLMQEAIRQLCVWELAKQSRQQDYWAYLKKYQACDAAGSKDCGAKALSAAAGVDQAKLQQCVSEERGSLAHFKDFAKIMGEEKVFAPSFVVNSYREDFGLSGLFVARTLCNGYSSKPPVCSCVATAQENSALTICVQKKCYQGTDKPVNCPNSDICVKQLADCVGGGSTEASGGVGGVGVFFIVLLSMSIVAAAALVYHKRVRRQMQEEVRDILSEYVPLEAFGAREGGAAQGQGFRRASNGDDTVGVI